MCHVHLPGAVGITPFVLVQVCQYPCVDSTARRPSVPSLAIARAARCLPSGARPFVPRRSNQSAPVRLLSRAARSAFRVQHDRARPACVQSPVHPTTCLSRGQCAPARPSETFVLFGPFRARGGC